ncbi:hypothetical protein EJV47_14215 [Hymenobacter gummosus]|uniref:Lipoprotein n=1 Tax=Hymenobacter gummosus TaxID=1776032 RepID=A0A431U282_9BACT|nr:hypothetical protein [Hymenobacter gummosus]RTQ49291.1 hypothetical protein EJV47_14215 [Hymenobacter gummosus]
MKQLRLTAALLLAGCAFGATSCLTHCDEEPEPAAEIVEVSYAQTYCADRWGEARGTQQLETVAKAYLLQQGITPQQLQAAAVNAPSVCNACSCTTGVVLKVSVLPADLQTMLNLGFKQ